MLSSYLAHLAVERGLSANTLASYRRDLRRYVEHLRARGLEPGMIDPVTGRAVAPKA